MDLQIIVLLTYRLESGAVVAVLIHNLIPHGSRANPKTLLPIECAVDHHSLQGFRMGCGADDFVQIAFEMTVFAGFDFHNDLQRRSAGDSPRRYFD